MNYFVSGESANSIWIADLRVWSTYWLKSFDFILFEHRTTQKKAHIFAVSFFYYNSYTHTHLHTHAWHIIHTANKFKPQSFPLNQSIKFKLKLKLEIETIGVCFISFFFLHNHRWIWFYWQQRKIPCFTQHIIWKVNFWMLFYYFSIWLQPNSMVSVRRTPSYLKQKIKNRIWKLVRKKIISICLKMISYHRSSYIIQI